MVKGMLSKGVRYLFGTSREPGPSISGERLVVAASDTSLAPPKDDPEAAVGDGQPWQYESPPATKADDPGTEDPTEGDVLNRGKTRVEVPVSRFSLQGTFSRIRSRKSLPAEPVETEVPHSPRSASPSGSHLAVDEALLQRLQTERSLLRRKLLQLSERVRVEEAARSTNMGEYLQLLRGAGGAQSLRLRRAFEQKNLRLSAVLSELRGRLRQYSRRLSELEAGIQLLRASSPRGSSLQATMQLADTKGHQVRFEPDGEAGAEEEAYMEEDGEEEWAESESAGTSNRDFPGGMGVAEWADQHLNLLSLLEEITELKEAQVVLEVNLNGLTDKLGRDYTVLEQMVQEESYRSNQLQSQMNDLIDLHQNEVINLKSELASLEEKIAYQSYESSRDIWEVLESFQVKLDSLDQLQQVSQVESREMRGTRELVGKCMNLLLMVFAVVLMAMSTVAALVLPFIRTRARTITTGLALLILLAVWRNWNSFSAWPRIRESQGE